VAALAADADLEGVVAVAVAQAGQPPASSSGVMSRLMLDA
jgi:hypothetical protein